DAAAATPNPDDLAYLNSDPERGSRSGAPSSSPVAHTGRAAGARPDRNDDFIYVEPPRFASTDLRSVRPAAVRYERDKAVIDERLEKKIDLSVKGISFADLCG